VIGPNFFVVGAAKSGTTALYHGLLHHDDVYLTAPKEPHFFAYLADPVALGHLYPDETAARRRYGELFAGVSGEAAVGDASTTNLVVEGAAEVIAREVPGARIVAVLRQPVDRAFSQWRHFRVAGGEDLADFAEALRQEDARAAAGRAFTYRYLGWGRYAGQLRPYVERFGRERVLVHLYDDLCADAAAVLRTTFRFLGVDESVDIPPLGRFNEMQAPARVGGWRSLIARRPPPPEPSLDPGLRAELTAGFEEEIAALEALIGRDLSAWR
jgi:hypothetical protein